MPLQAAPALVGAAPVASTSSYPSILPGPFILLLALPAIPLLLFSVGARPPDSSALPFSTDDVWQTTAFVTVAGAVVLCIGIYPEAFTDVGNWIADGASGDTWRDKWSSLTSNGPSWTHKEVIQTSNGRIQSQVGGMRMPMGVAERQATSIKIIPPPRAPPLIRKSVVKVRPPQMVQDKHGNKWMKPGAKRRVSQLIPNPAAVLQNEADVASANDLSNRHFPSIAAKRLAYMREGVLAPWYSPDRASLFGAAIACILVIGFFIVVTGKILGDAYDADRKNKSSGGSSRGSGGGKEEAWYLRELRKRKGEKEAETIARVGKDNKEWQAKLEKMKDEDKKKTVERRKKEIEVLKKELEKRKMPLVALEIGGASGSGKSKKIKGDSKPSGNVVKADTGGKVKTSSKLKRFFLGPLADGPPKDKSLTRPATMTLPAEGGPGWKPADDAIAHAAIRGGASRAENMANDLVKQKNA